MEVAAVVLGVVVPILLWIGSKGARLLTWRQVVVMLAVLVFTWVLLK